MRRCCSLYNRTLFFTWRNEEFKRHIRSIIDTQRGARQELKTSNHRASNRRQKSPVRRFQQRHISVTETSPPPDPQNSLPVWTDPSGGMELELQRQIFCNRSLTMDSIKAVGFDMDYTLAQYKAETFEVLAYEESKKKLVHMLGYPQEVLDMTFDCYYIMRGLVVDKKRGNLLKVDRHKYVKIAYHGFQKLPEEKRQNLYGRPEIRDAFDEPDYSMTDTLFSISEAYLFMKLVEMKEQRPELLEHKTFLEMSADVRFSVDTCHKDGTLKMRVAENPGKYIHTDGYLVSLFEMLQQSGKSLFLATNSLWDYTNIAMNFLLANRTGRDCNTDWLKYFDVVITGCSKPRFFYVKNALFLVDPVTGHLFNTDDGAPTARLHRVDNGKDQSGSQQMGNGKVFQGGHYTDLHRMLSVHSGTEVLYVGDHIYGDILKSKKTLGWRTMLIVPELKPELEILTRCRNEQQRLLKLRQQRNALEDKLHHIRWRMSINSEIQQTNGHKLSEEDTIRDIEKMETERQEIAAEHRNGLREYHEQFHPIWGRLLKTGHQSSLLAHQIDRFACLYTSHVSNLAFYSPYKRMISQLTRSYAVAISQRRRHHKIVMQSCITAGQIFFLDPFAIRQWDDVNHAGTRIDYDKVKFVEQVHDLYATNKYPLKDGYAPFCKHLFVENFVEARSGVVEITEDNAKQLKSDYKHRRPEELAVLTRWFSKEDVEAPLANYLDLILYSRDQILKESKTLGGGLPYEIPDMPWGIISIKGQMEDYETPMAPITMLRNALGTEYGGSGITLDVEEYKLAVEYWRTHALVL